MSGCIAAARRSLVAAGIALLLVAGVVAVLPIGTARADTAPLNAADPTTPATVSADPLPTVQINGVAWAQVVVGNTVYVTGQFSRVRPAGAAPGTQEVVRNNLLAYDIRTGQLITSFAPSLNAQGRVLTASPDGSRIYVGGDFSSADGQPRFNVAAYSTATGQLIPNWRPAVGQPVRAIAATASTVYLGGDFGSVGGTARNRLAAVSATDGSLLPWRPQPGVGSTAGNRLPNNPTANAQTSNSVLSLTLAGGHVIAAGRFDTLNGVKATGVGALDPVSGATRPFAINQLLTNQGVNSAVYSLSTDGTTVYGTAYDYYGPGNLEGSFAASAATGALLWINDCHGDTYSSFPMNGALYHATHAHVCSNIGSFPEMTPRVNMYGTAVSLAVAGRTGSATLRNANLANRPAPAVLPWWPTFYSGTYTGQYQAGWTVAGNGDYLVYGGEFPGVNGTEQQGLVRFAVRDIAPNRVAPRATATFQPTATMLPGAVRISWPAVSDRDNEHLTYRVYRDSEADAPVCQTTRGSEWWRLPTFACTDTTATAGSHRYLVTATDPFGNALSSSWTTATVGSANSGGGRMYADVVRADGALDHWPLGEPSGPTAYDRTAAQDMTVNGGVTPGAGGAIAADPDTAFRFNGATNGFVSTRSAVPGPQRFSVEAWFQTTTAAGGKIIGFGNAQTGTSTAYDRQLFMDTAGRLHFGVNNGAARQVDTTTAYNDGRWHHVVGTLDGTGMAFYVDGQLIGKRTDVTSAQAYSGFWRVGGDRNWNSQPFWFAGLIDEVAVYPSALTPAQVAAHNAAGRSGEAPNVAPTASFTAAPAGLTASVDGSASTDGDGRITGYAWDFGDGGSGSGATASHSYATAGTYTVRLTVTDDDGATGTVTRQVTVTAPPTGAGSIAADGFDRTVSAGWGTADRGGVWTIGGGAASTSVTGGSGQLTGAPRQGLAAVLGGVSAQDVALQADLVLPLAPTGGGTYVSLGGRQGGGSDYRLTVWYQATGQVNLRLDRMINYSETVLASQRVLESYQPGSSLTVRFEVEGTSVRAKAWPTGTAEPAGWTVSATDDTAALQRPGPLFVETYTSGSATRASTVRVDNVRAEPAGTVVTPAPNAAPTAEFSSSVADLKVSVDGTASADSDGTVAAYAWNFGDGSAPGSGATASHTYAAAGTYQVTLTVTDDKGATATRTRAVTVTAPAPAPNAAPTAEFSSSVADLKVSVDGTASADSDGTVAAYAWNFGDGSAPGSGATASHTYAAAGTYQVTLTVTDDKGATATRTRSVTVTAPAPTPDPAVQPLAADAFGRDVATGWGTADRGGAWTVVGAAANASVTGGAGRLTGPAGNGMTASLAGVSAQDLVLQVDLSLPEAATGGGTYVSLASRQVGGTQYQATVRFLSTGQVDLRLDRVVSGAETVVAIQRLPGSYVPGTSLTVRFEVSGAGTTALRAKAWTTGSAEPAAWTVTATDTTAGLQRAGAVLLETYTSGSATRPSTVRVDNLWAGPAGSTPPAP